MNCSENTKRPKKVHLRRRIDFRPILKYAALALVGFLMFKLGAVQARIDRGYSAIGGEALFLLLPLFYYLISKTVRDWLDDLKK